MKKEATGLINGRGRINQAYLQEWIMECDQRWDVVNEKEQRRLLRALRLLQRHDVVELLESKGSVDQKQQIVAALLTHLRQKIGSCFATAPAIMIHELQPLQFIRDCQHLLMQKNLSRVVEGREILAPRVNWGSMDLLSSWEYTLASFTEQHNEGCAWNLITSLGLNQSNDHGLGKVIVDYWNEKLTELFHELEETQSFLERSFLEIEALRARAKSNEANLEWLRGDLYGRQSEFNILSEKKELLQEKAKQYKSAPQVTVDAWMKLIPNYFQEVFDPTLSQEYGPQEYDHAADRAAGFRLLCKFGRIKPEAWQLVFEESTFYHALENFFITTEREISDDYFEGITTEFSQSITRVVQVLRTPDFIAAVTGRSLKHRSSQTPWAYHSGGTLETLLANLNGRMPPLTKQQKWSETAEELLVFFNDTLQHLLSDKTYERVLMTSPTHAFSLLPFHPYFEEFLQDDSYPYTWIKERLLEPGQHFFELHRSQIESVDPSWLYANLPLFPSSEMIKRAQKVLKELQIDCHIEPSNISEQWCGAKDLFSFIAQLLTRHKIHRPMQRLIIDTMRSLGYAAPQPVIFADTNWEHWYFAFLVHPITLQLDLWCVDEWGIEGFPLLAWQKWWNGGAKEMWTIYANPLEYWQS